MLKKIQSRSWIYILVFALILFGVITLANYQYSNTNPGGNDFLVHWLGTRTFLTEGTSPYSSETALKIQTMVYGHAAKAGEHELRVAYPLYSIIIFAPFALIQNFTIARALWMSVLEFGLIAVAFFSIRLTYWKVKPWLIGVFFLFMFVSYNGARPLINGNVVILVTLFVLLALLCIRDEKDEIAGILLAISTIKPQNVVLLIAFILFWAIVNHRTKLIAWFLGSMVILVGFSMVLIPDWIVQNFREVLRYPSYNPPGSIGAAMAASLGDVGQRLSYALTAILAVILGAEWWSGRKAGPLRFLWLAFLTITVSQWIGIQTDPGNFILLYPAMFFCFALIDNRWKKWSNIFTTTFLGIVTAGIWVLFVLTVHKSYQLIQSSYLFLPLPMLVFLLLYWVRWWAIKRSQVDYFDKTIGI